MFLPFKVLISNNLQKIYYMCEKDMKTISFKNMLINRLPIQVPNNNKIYFIILTFYIKIFIYHNLKKYHRVTL
jgi:hypothetical protein